MQTQVSYPSMYKRPFFMELLLSTQRSCLYSIVFFCGFCINPTENKNVCSIGCPIYGVILALPMLLSGISLYIYDTRQNIAQWHNSPLRTYAHITVIHFTTASFFPDYQELSHRLTVMHTFVPSILLFMICAFTCLTLTKIFPIPGGW